MKVLLAVVTIFLIHLPSSAFAQEVPHPVFLPLTENRVRTTFAAYEAKGKEGDQVQFGLEKPIEFRVQGEGGTEVLKFHVGIMPPISEVRKSGYEFGKLGRGPTPADRKAVLNGLVQRMTNAPQVIPFYVRVEGRSDWSTSIDLLVELVNEQGITILPQQQPTLDCPVTDIICQFVMAQTGVPINFPLYFNNRETPPRSVPFVTNQMKELKLIVKMGDAQRELSFVLSSIN